METKTMKKFPQILEVGMKITAVCMGREVGNYVITEVSSKLAFLEKEDSDPEIEEKPIICAERSVGKNGLVTVLFGKLDIQSVDYFVKPL